MRNFLRRKCPYLDICPNKVTKEHYKDYCRPIILGDWFWCKEWTRLDRIQREQNMRKPSEWDQDSKIQGIQLPHSLPPPFQSKSSKMKKPSDWFNPSKRSN